MEKGINPNENGLQYLIRHIDSQIVIHNFDENETNILKYSKYTLEKEIKYLSSDEERVNNILEILKNNKVTPIGVKDVITDLSRKIIFS